MKCKKCKKENAAGAKYCKYCGELLFEMKTCPNGHQYNSSESNCPYCPPPGGERVINPFGDMKTVAESPDASQENYDKTVVDNSNPILSQSNYNTGDKTIILDPQQSEPKLRKMQYSSRKLIGWLVTFDIDPNGKDFRLYEGRTTIGKDSKNDIVLLDPSVSSLHATILFRPQDKKIFIQDNLSTNGSFVNDVLIDDKQTLADNDRIRIGNINLILKLI